MKNVPDKIYLQIDADGETPEDFKELACVSWCEDKIYDNDIEYVKSNPGEQGQEEAWADLLFKLPGICASAPINEPERENYITQKLKSYYHLIKK